MKLYLADEDNQLHLVAEDIEKLDLANQWTQGDLGKDVYLIAVQSGWTKDQIEEEKE